MKIYNWYNLLNSLTLLGGLMPVLLLSILASVVIWTYLFSFKLAIVLIVAVFIHEYGHFYWMGREGIKDKDMFFLPPFGAVARSKEPWPSHGAEMRIALAGPAFGLLSVMLFYFLWLIFPGDLFPASMAIAGMINLFNLALPIPILDGGRIIKSILYSIHRKLGDIFYWVGFLILFAAFVYSYLSIIFFALIAFLLYEEWAHIHYTRNILEKLKLEVNECTDPESLKKKEEKISWFDGIVNMKKMTGGDMVLGLVFFTGVILAYVFVLYAVSYYIDLDMLSLRSYFE